MAESMSRQRVQLWNSLSPLASMAAMMALWATLLEAGISTVPLTAVRSWKLSTSSTVNIPGATMYFCFKAQ